MIYTVVWTPSARKALWDLYFAASNRQEVSNASNWIDEALKRDPLRNATQLGRHWKLARRPLEVLFGVDDGDRMVKVLMVRKAT
jgi:mRNA-degrading endonuclease RelE of RelBE toxin-antitoxin system